MTIQSDYEEILKTFKKVGPLNKVLMVLFFFLTVSSLTSLADVIFGWKGFILQALGTYHGYFVNPIIKMATFIGLKYQPNEIHAATLMSVSVGIGMRSLAAGQIVAFKKINQQYNTDIAPNLTFYWLAGILFPPSIWCWYGLSEQSPNLWWVGSVFVFYPLCIVIPKVFMSKFGFKDGYLEKEEFSYFKAYYSYVAAALIVLGVLGAINAGLTKVA